MKSYLKQLEDVRGVELAHGVGCLYVLYIPWHTQVQAWSSMQAYSPSANGASHACQIHS
jgi:hypothetical protein